MINYITNLPQTLRSGGFSAMNVAAWKALSARYDACYIGPIDPPVRFAEKALSKALRVVGKRGDYAFFSQRRLERIAAAVSVGSDPRAQLDFYHGFTPWIMANPSRPYLAWSDCTFVDYIDIYHDRASFSANSLARIERLEASWLKRAEQVAFTSKWAAQRAISIYGLDPARVDVVGIFGEVDEPDRDVFEGPRSFAFISTNFEAKGGRTVLSAFRLVRARYPDVRLFIVGERPVNIADEPGVEMTGFLRKEVLNEYQQFRDVLGHTRAIVHPTQSDVTPLILIEAGFFGCPVIASNSYAIPELVEHGRTGWLLDDPTNADAIAKAMFWMLENDNAYATMRRTAWARVRARNRRDQFDDHLSKAVARTMRVTPP